MLGHDVLSLAERKLNPSDLEIIQMALADQRIVVTEDADFGTLIFTGVAQRSGVVRVEQTTPLLQLKAVSAAIEEHEDALRSGAVVTVRRGKTRISNFGTS
jgi:predicted nuclease of predicted toxin-antitoxin system